MSVTTRPTAPEHHPDSARSVARRPPPTGRPTPLSMPLSRAPGAVTLFEVPFASVLNDFDLALLAQMLNLSTRMHPKDRPRHDTPGFARLDHYSGLFLKRGAIEGDWILQALTWGHPAAQSVHEWHVLAAGAAHQLDPTVTSPERLDASSLEIPDRPLGRAANKRLARIRRRLVGLP
jgi:hypothetical protein